MKDTATKARFVELRAQGFSYNRISEELHTSKQALINWGRELEEEINNLRGIELEAIQERFLITKEKRLEVFCGILQKIGEELNTRDLADVETSKLLDMFLKVYATVKDEGELPRFLSEIEVATARERREHTIREESASASLGF